MRAQRGESRIVRHREKLQLAGILIPRVSQSTDRHETTCLFTGRHPVEPRTNSTGYPGQSPSRWIISRTTCTTASILSFWKNGNFSENLLKTMNMMVEVDILLIKQIELKYLSKIKKLLYLLACRRAQGAQCKPVG